MRRLRRRKLIKPALQLKLIAVFCFCGLLAVLTQTILLSRGLALLAGKAGPEEARILSEAPGIVLSNLMLTSAILVPLFASIGVLVTFRIAGPVYRFERYLREYSDVYGADRAEKMRTEGFRPSPHADALLERWRRMMFD